MEEEQLILMEEESKSSDLINQSVCEKSMEDQAILMEEESKSFDPINQSVCEKSMKDQVIAIDEQHITSDPINPRYMISDKDRFELVAVISTVLCLLLIIFPTLKTSDCGKMFMEKHHTVVMVLLFGFVFFSQLLLFGFTVDHPVNSSIFGVLYILLISSTISVIEVSLVSRTAAIIVLIMWIIIIGTAIHVNWQEITRAHVEASKGVQKFVAIISVISLLCMINCIVHTLSS